MIFRCQNCGTPYKIRDELLAQGPRRGKCKKCGEMMTLELQGPEPGPEAVVENSSGAPLSSSRLQDSEGERSDVDDSGGKEAAASHQEGTPEITPKAAETSPEADSRNSGADSTWEPEENEADKEKKVQPESVMERMERQRSEIEDNILGKISKDALDTMELEELKSLAEKIHSIEENRTYDTEEGTELFTCLNCKTVFALFPDDPRKCTNCSDKVSLVKAEEVLKHCDMLYG